ncbi:Aspartic peptidase domain superfamily [Sesbania bispinosa]|nr:Aspartic peptidase domain superfamily [Sesbania bispinosa]
MTDRARRIAPRRLSFNLEDFPEMDAERLDPNDNAGKGPTNDGLDNTTFVIPEGTGSGVREELNLIGALETPATLVSKGNDAPHVVVPTAILQSIIASQESLTHLVSDLRTQVKGDEGMAGKDSGGKQGVTPIIRHDDAPVTQAELRRLLQAERGSPNMLFELEPPLTEEVLSTTYPVGYQPPSFRKFDDTSSAREHLMCFLDDLGVHRDNKSLRLKEFSKSLARRAFTWYAKLRPGSIRSWEELAIEFCGKFLEEGSVLHIMDLGRCKETLPEADLVYGCIKNIEDGSQIFLSLGGITTFTELMRRGADIAEAMKRQGKRTKEANNVFDVCALEDKGRKTNFRGPHSSKEYAQNNTEDLSPMPISRVQVCQLVEEWLKDEMIRLKGNRTPLTKEQGEDIGDLHRRPLPDHGVNVITVADKEIRIEEVKEEDNDEEKLLSTGLAKTRGFRILFSLLGLDQKAQKEAARALTKIVKEKGGELGTANGPLTRLARSHATTILFREPSFQGAKFCHNRPLYVEACVEGIRVRHALVDNGSGVNIMATQLFRLLNIPKQRVHTSNITLNTFQGEPVESKGCVNAVLEVGPIKTVNMFQVVDGDPNYHLLLGRPWIHLHQCVPSTLHRRVKSNFRGKEIEIPGVAAPFEASEAHLIDVSLFDEWAPPGNGHIGSEPRIVLDQGRAHPLTTVVKRSRGRNESGVEKKYFPNGQVRWRIL